VVEDAEKGSIIQLQGNHKIPVAKFFIWEGILSKEEIQIH